LSSRMLELPALLRSNLAFSRYLFAAGLAALAASAVPFYILYAGERIVLTGTYIGVLTFAFMLAGTVVTPAWGYLADRVGNKIVYISAIGVWAASLSSMLLVNGDWILVVVFSGVGVGLGGFQIASQNILLEFGDRNSLPMMLGVANTTTSIMAATGPILAGLFIESFSYSSLFAIAIFLKIMAVIVMLLFVKEPRHQA
jgi:MFS family permease